MTFFIFTIMGVSMIVLWLYLNARTKRQKNDDKNIIITKQPCICTICKHQESKICLQQKCACCIIMKEDTIIGHSSNPLR
jgi:hypothetical protein